MNAVYHYALWQSQRVAKSIYFIGKVVFLFLKIFSIIICSSLYLFVAMLIELMAFIFTGKGVGLIDDESPSDEKNKHPFSNTK